MLTPVDQLPYQAYSSTIAPAIRSFLPRLVNDYPCLEVQPIIRIYTIKYLFLTKRIYNFLFV